MFITLWNGISQELKIKQLYFCLIYHLETLENPSFVPISSLATEQVHSLLRWYVVCFGAQLQPVALWCCRQ